ncbi:MAG: hypothetical protein HY831_00470 [Candidatus Aenigmarchaeota archaeon]|nr:hypothetical protein [Candidatus Aenigmarchaeota archaeon]
MFGLPSKRLTSDGVAEIVRDNGYLIADKDGVAAGSYLGNSIGILRPTDESGRADFVGVINLNGRVSMDIYGENNLLDLVFLSGDLERAYDINVIIKYYKVPRRQTFSHDFS